MPITDVIKRRTYQNERKARIKQEAQIDDALVGNPQIAQAEEMERIAQEYSDRAARVRAEERARVSNGIDNAQNGLDKYGFPIGTHDEGGRELGQLDTANDELASLNENLSKLNVSRETLTTELDKVQLITGGAASSQLTTEQKIQNKTRIAAIKELIKDNEAELSTLKDKITSKQSNIEKYEGEVKRIKDDITPLLPGGRIYISKVAQAEILLGEAQQQKSTALTNLNSGHYGEFDQHHWQSKLNCANANIDTHSTPKDWCAAQVAKFEGMLKWYTLKEI